MGMKMKINPVYKNELKMNVRTMKTSFVLLGYNGVLMIIGILTFYIVFGSNPSYSRGNYGEVLALYCLITMLEVGMVLFVVPALTSGAIAGEREKQTLEILLTTTLKPRQIVWGKLASSMSLLLLLVTSSLPIVSIVFSIGGIEFKDLIQLVFTATITSFYIGSIGIYFSTLFKRSIPATIATYGITLLVSVGTIFILALIYQIAQGNETTVKTGAEVIILLLNPIVTLLSMLSIQYGAGSSLGDFLLSLGSNSVIMNEWAGCWFILSVIVQIVIGIIIMECAARRLDPNRNNKKKKSL